VPEEERSDPWAWTGWTGRALKQGLKRIAQAAKLPAEKLLARATENRRQTQQSNQGEVNSLQRKLREIRQRVKAQKERQRQRRMLPDGATLEKITRYEAHLSRQMLQALHTLERLQAARAGQAFPPPAALDVTVDTAPPLGAENPAEGEPVG
jgi:hypothetical protein